jgi:hypothetical protein
MSIVQGAVYAASYTVPGVVVGTTVVLTVTDPTGVVTTPTVTPGGVGVPFTASVPGTLVGSYLLVWSASGATVDVAQDQFTTIAPTLNLVSLSDVRTELNFAPSDTTKNLWLQDQLRAATALIENICDPILPATRVDVFDGDRDAVLLPFRWVSALTSVIETIATVNYVLTEQPLGASVNNYGYTWDRTINKIVRRGAGGAAMRFTSGVNNVAVTYTVGINPVPQDIQLAVTRLVKHWYKQTFSAASGIFAPTSEDEAGATIVGNYLVPYAVMEMLEPYRRRPGIF